MRLISYNILEGGAGRADLLTEVIASQRPDVIALVEADDGGVVERIAARLKMDFIHAPGNEHASALLSRFPIRQTINHGALSSGLKNSLLEATIIRPDGSELVVGVLHFRAGAFEEDEAEREKELQIVLDLFQPYRQRGTPHLLCGDFNANSPIQQIDPARCKPKTRDAWEKNGGTIPRRVVQKLLDSGYVDTLAALRPAEAPTLASFTTQYPGQRVDYIFAFGVEPARLADAWIEQDRLATYASDHYPIGAAID
jgi:endonuclease/exonuclease/phosphatase family metal-dependent hydrolase